MKVDVSLSADPLAVEDAAHRAEADGFDGVRLGETAHDPLLGCAVAGRATSRIDVGTGIAVAFARSPMTLAVAANDLQQLTRGRFVLGLGTQVKAHITRRFSMPWSRPAARMREFVLALRAIWRSWQDGRPLDFAGEFYTHTLMSPVFDPGPNGYGPPRVLLAGVGAGMTRVAGEVADGFLCHGFTTATYLREVTLPALVEARQAAGASMTGFDVGGVPFLVTAHTEEEMGAAKQRAREQIAFYASTPAYRPVLEAHGWGDLQSELHPLSRSRRWTDMAARIDDEVLDTFAVVAEPDELAARIRDRYAGLLTRVQLNLPAALPRDAALAIVEELRT